MNYSLQQGKLSNYQVTITLSAEELMNHKEGALKQFQKDANIEGFRPGHAPLSMVEQRISPEYLKVAMYEEVLHAATNMMLTEHPDKKFIGQMYDLKIDDAKPEVISLTFTIDIYPDTAEKNDAWKKVTAKPINTEASEKEIAETLLNLQRQYANYKEATQVGKESVFKVSLRFLDKSGEEVHTGKLYLGKEDIEEFPQLATYFFGKKENDTVSIAYDEKQLPPTMHTQKPDIKAKEIEATVGDIKDMELPEFTPENIKKFFGSDDVTNEAELKAKVKTLIENQKEESTLMQTIDTYLQDVMKSFNLIIPKTLIDEEVKTRFKSLQERMGGEEGVKKYFEQIGEEEVKKLHTSITEAARSSLEKFLILKEVVEKLGITDINREAHLDVEKKLYAKISK
jgi:trigger factor